MNDLYSPATGEHINTDTPATWMGRAGKPVPDYDASISSCFWRGDDWEIVMADTPAKPDYSSLREQVYRAESDQLFFKEQRGEVPVGTWLAKVAEIKARYPN